MPDVHPDEELVRPIAAQYAKFYKMVERDDIAQELRLWWLTNQRSVKRYLGDEDEKAGQRKLYRSLQRAAGRFCRTEKAALDGYRTDDEAFYDPSMIRSLLPMVWDDSLITETQRSLDSTGKITSTKRASEGNTLPVMVADITLAVDTLSQTDKDILYQFYGRGLDQKDVADQLDITVTTTRKRESRAINRVRDALGGESPWTDGPGSRRVFTNAHAIAQTKGSYDDD